MADLRLYQPSFTGGELSPALWARIDLAKYSTGLKVAKNVFVHAHGGVSNRAGLEFVGEVKNSGHHTRLIPFQFNTEQSYILEFGNMYMRVYKDGGLVTSGGSPYEMATGYSHFHVGDLVVAQEADVMYAAHVSYPPRKLGRLADDNWTIGNLVVGPDIAAPTGQIANGTHLTGGVARSYKIAAIDAATGEESLPSGATNSISNDLSLAGHYNEVAWVAVPGASRYVVYKSDNGVFGYIGGTEALTFKDDNITADLSDTPQSTNNPFAGPGDYPRCVTFIEQRLAFASSDRNPQAVWMSQSANYENFNISQPARASDAVSFRIRSRQVNEIRAMLPLRGLMLLTSGSEWIVSGGSQADAISPSAIKVDPQGYRGAAKVQPIVVGSTVLFAQNRGGVVRDFSYEFAEDAFTGKDLTVLARHLFKDRTIKAWAYAQAPHSIVWVVLDNGALVSLTYMKEHEVWGWTRHETDGLFDDVTVIEEGGEDVPYFIVQRVIGGVTKRYIERLRSRSFNKVEDAFFVDSGLSYSGAPVTNLSGLDHLEGKTVVALADGNVVRGLTVTGGSITLPREASKVHVGLPYEATAATLDFDLGSVQGLGTVQGRKKSIDEVTFRVEETRGIWLGYEDFERDSDKTVEYKQRAVEAWNEAIQLYTGDLAITAMPEWTDGGTIVIKQFDPLPMTVLAIMPNVSVGG